MCGVIGVFSRQGVPPDVRKLLPLLRHRGPDGQGHVIDGPLALGHTRLSIIDLSAQAAQPMRSCDGRFLLSYNGEIYNYLELRASLRERGACFATASDTEVVLEAYRVWGTDCVRRFRGMFAFALWDAEARTLFLARDRCGERPLFYHRTAEAFFFASELKALLPLLPEKPDLNPAAVDMYLHYQYTPEPFTLLQGVHKLPAAHTLLLSAADWDAQPVRYWNVETCVAQSPLPTDAEGILAAIRESLEEAVVMTLRADVPVAVALSGGIDSGAIAALAQKHSPEPLHAFSVGYPGRPPYDERDQARELAERLGMIFHEVEIPVDDFVDFFPSLVRIMDEPIADPAAFGHFAVPRAAHEMGIKVLLTGIGGDELFWGYEWVRQAAVTNAARSAQSATPMLIKLLSLPGMERIARRAAHSARFPHHVRRALARWLQLKPYMPQAGPDALAFYETTPDFAYARANLASLYGERMQETSPLNAFTPEKLGARKSETVPAAIIRLLFDTWLVSNCLTLGDRVSMGSSVEARLPFLDVKLIELVMALRSKTPDHQLHQKEWLRRALKNILPDEVLKRPKAGFQPPVQAWLGGVIARYGERLHNGYLVRSGIVHADSVASLLLSRNQDWSRTFFIYKLVLLECWCAYAAYNDKKLY